MTPVAPGDRVFRWWDAGISMEMQPLTVVRVNRVTVTVRTDQGSTFRMPPADIAGPYVEDKDTVTKPAEQPDTETVECFTRDHDRCGGYTDDGDLCECECHDVRAQEYLRQQ